MPTYTIFSDASDSSVLSEADGVGLWLTVRTGNNLSSNDLNANQSAVTIYYNVHKGVTTYQAKEVFLSFDTSVITDTDVIDSAVVSLYGQTRSGATSDIVEVYAKDWGGTVTTADWVAGEDIGALTLLASFTATAAPGNWSTSAYNAFTENGSNLRSAINKTGVMYVMLCLDELRSVVAPTASSIVGFYMANQTGTTQDPKLVITTTATASTSDFFQVM